MLSPTSEVVLCLTREEPYPCFPLACRTHEARTPCSVRIDRRSRERRTISAPSSSRTTCVRGILYEKGNKLKLSGNEVYFTACSLLVVLENLCGKLHLAGSFNLNKVRIERRSSDRRTISAPSSSRSTCVIGIAVENLGGVCPVEHPGGVCPCRLRSHAVCVLTRKKLLYRRSSSTSVGLAHILKLPRWV